MTPEQIENTIDFILRQQAQFAVEHENLAKDLRRLSGAMETLTSSVQTVAAATLALADNADRDREHLHRLDQIIESDRKRLDRLERNS
jgi:hypothetical protein